MYITGVKSTLKTIERIKGNRRTTSTLLLLATFKRGMHCAQRTVFFKPARHGHDLELLLDCPEACTVP
jgi:hypothetical protein